MKYIPFLTAILLAFALPSAAEEAPPIPVVSANIESFDALDELTTAVVKATNPKEKSPFSVLRLLMAGHPDAINTTRPWHVAVYLNGMFTPLVAVYIPTDDFAAFKKLSEENPDKADITFEKVDGHCLALFGAETSLEANLAAARAIDTAGFKTERPVEMTVQFDDPTRTMIKGVLAMGRLQIMKESEGLGDEQTVKMMKAILPLYFDLFEGFIDGMEQTTLAFDIVDKGFRYSIRSTAKEGTTFSNFIAKSPMDPTPLSENYQIGNAFEVSARMGKMDAAFSDILEKLMSAGMEVSGQTDEKARKETVAGIMGLMDDMTPMYMSFGYNFDGGQLGATGTYFFPEAKDVTTNYDKLVKFAADMGEQMSGKGKMYKDFKHKNITVDGLEIDRFSYTMGDDFPPNPLMGDKMEFEYALSGDRMLFSMGGEGVNALLKKPKDPAPLPEFLQPKETTVMIGHLDIISIMGSFSTLEITDDFDSPAIFIADKKDKPKKNKGAKASSNILMRADIDDDITLDIHIPLSLLRTLSRLQ